MKYHVVLSKPYELRTVKAGSIQEADKLAGTTYPFRLAHAKSVKARIL